LVRISVCDNFSRRAVDAFCSGAEKQRLKAHLRFRYA
jgi:hypothetical protein